MPIIYVRPRIRYQASTAILCRAGSDLGATMTGHHDFQLADDVIHKVHVGHYTFYSIAVVKNEKLLQKAQGVFCRDYMGGEGSSVAPVSGTKSTSGDDIFVLEAAGAFRMPNTVLMPTKVDAATGNCVSDYDIGNADEESSHRFQQALHALLKTTDMVPPSDTGSLFSSYEDADEGERSWANLAVKGTHVSLHDTYVNPLGLGPCTYNGCSLSRQGRGDPMDMDRCLRHVNELRSAILSSGL